MLDALFGNLPVIEKSLSGLTAREQALAQNVANADTPGYKRIEVSYERQLRDAITQASSTDLPLETTDPRHYSLGPAATIEAVRPLVTQVTNESSRNDGNDVDIESEMAKLAETTIRYNTMAALAKNNFSVIQEVLRDVH